MNKTIVIITDAWTSAGVNGVVTALLKIQENLEKQGFRVVVIHPGMFFSVALPSDKSIRLSMFVKGKLERMLRKENPDYIHIATEGPLGLAGRRVCLNSKWPFTTFYHTRFPEYIEARFGGFKNLTYRYERWFHRASAALMVSTPSLKRELEARGFINLVVTPLGADLELFKHNPLAVPLPGMIKPIFVFLGRVAVEKNIEAFLKCDLPGSKLIIGDGPSRKELETKYHGKAVFAGYKTHTEVVDLLSASDVFVFPSKTDTFGLVIVEAMACGLPVAAYDVQGPADIVTNGVDGFLGEDLEGNAKKCLQLNRQKCIEKAQQYSWANSVKKFIENIAHSVLHAAG